MKRLASALVALLALVLMPVGSTMADDAPTGEPFTLNLQEAELRSLIETVAERTGRRFIVDPRVDARVTVISSVPIASDELYEVFLSVLQVHGYAAVDIGEMTLIIPRATAPQHPVPVEDADEPSAAIVTRVVAVEHVSAEQIVPLLQPLIGENGQLAAYGATNRLILTDSARNTERLRRIVERIDRPMERDIEAVRLDNARAEEVVRVLTTLADDDTEAATALAADPRSNSVLIRGSEATRIEMRALIADLDQPADLDEDTRVVHMRHAEAAELVDIVAEAARAQADLHREGGAEADERETIVQADENSNALILSGRPEILDGLDSLIRQLDIRRAQVHVEAMIAELSMDRVRELGVQFAAGREGTDSTFAGLTRFSEGGSDIVNIATSPESVDSGLTIGALGEAGRHQFGAILRAVAADADNNILSTPSLVTMDNQEAEILVGQNVPFVTGQFTGADVGDEAGRSPFQTIEREDIGITLGITPQINEGDAVQLEIEQEVSDLSGTAQAADLVTNTREIRTTVIVEDGQTLVLGGLIDDSVQTSREQVPLLGDLPVLGQLFRYDATETVQQNLMVFLQPTIMRDAEAGDELTRAPYEAMRSRQMGHADDHSTAPGMGPRSEDLPVLPELEVEARE